MCLISSSPLAKVKSRSETVLVVVFSTRVGFILELVSRLQIWAGSYGKETMFVFTLTFSTDGYRDGMQCYLLLC